MTLCPLLVGSESDTHLHIVAERLQKRNIEPIIFDANSLTTNGYSLSPDKLMIDGKTIGMENRGWLRRVAPSRWTTGDLVGSVADISLRTRVRLVATIVRHGNRRWLTDIDALQAAEDRIRQLAVAFRIGIATPPTIVTSDPLKICHALGDDVILKPLATGAFVNAEGQPQTVHTTLFTSDILASGDFEDAPFIAQKKIEVRRHLRVVTAGTTVRTAALEADDWPLDWRATEEAHSSWVPHKSPEIEAQAVRLAAKLDVGFSSQDWLIPAEGPPLFIDLNPAGQWMFLPESVADPITNHIVNFLSDNHD